MIPFAPSCFSCESIVGVCRFHSGCKPAWNRPLEKGWPDCWTACYIMLFQTIFSEGHDKEDTTTFVERVDSVLKLLNEHWGEYPDKMVTNHFPRLQNQVDGVIRFALTVHKLMKSGVFTTSTIYLRLLINWPQGTKSPQFWKHLNK